MRGAVTVCWEVFVCLGVLRDEVSTSKVSCVHRSTVEMALSAAASVLFSGASSSATRPL